MMRKTMRWPLGVLVGFLAFALSSVVMFPDDGTFGPDVLTGWPNRFMIVTFSVWLMVVARQAIRSSAQQPTTLGRAGAR